MYNAIKFFGICLSLLLIPVMVLTIVLSNNKNNTNVVVEKKVMGQPGIDKPTNCWP